MLEPKNESERLHALRSLWILDTPPEKSFDDLATLASYVCGTPIALIGFMDSNRLWLKSNYGWDISEIPREMSLCNHTINQAGVLLINDVLEDQRFKTCPLATNAGIRFYCGVSLISPGGYALGTLSVMDIIPRGLTEGQVNALRKLGEQVMALLAARRLAFSLKDEAAGQTEVTVVGQGSSEQKRAEEALRHSEQRLQGIIGSAMDAIITIDRHQRIVVFNKAAEKIFHCSAAAAVGQLIDKFIPEKFRAIHREHIQGFSNTGVTSRSMYSPGALLALRSDGEEFPIEATISKVETTGETLFTVILRDISARLKMEAALRQAQKMEAVGQLAGGISHEFNNYLGVILGYTELLSEESVGAEKLAEHVRAIKSATQHAGSLTRQLLAFSRKQVVEPQVLDLNEVIWDSHKLLRRLVPANIDVVPVLAPGIGRVRIDPGQLQQILINLLVNARDAMPQGGRIVVETSEVEVNVETVNESMALERGSYVLLAIADTGAGMNEETRAHLFEPFYTTKQPGKGTGLGLSTVYGIVRHSRGHISVESFEGKGTTFRIYLPRVEQAVTKPVVVAAKPSPHLIGSATVLVVEDETALRRLLCMSLERRKHKVLAAKDGAEALELFREYASQVQLIITDLMMPRMDGLALKRNIAALNPQVKFLFMSGYAEEIVEQHRGSLEGCGFLEKPFLPEELAEKVSQLLAGVVAA